MMHINARSQMQNMDMIQVWVHTADPDVLVLSETWFKKSVLNQSIGLDGYNVYRCDRRSKGEGIFHPSILKTDMWFLN